MTLTLVVLVFGGIALAAATIAEQFGRESELIRLGLAVIVVAAAGAHLLMIAADLRASLPF